MDELYTALDTFIPQPVRETDKPFLMPVEDVFSITGRGTVATGRIERGVVKVGEEVQVWGGGGEETAGAGGGGGRGGEHHAAHALRGRGVRADEGRGGAAHAVLQGVPAAVLLPDDGRDGVGGAAGGGGDGDAGGQCADDDRADHPDRDGRGAALCDPRGRPHRGRRRRHQDPQVAKGQSRAARQDHSRMHRV